MKVNDYSKDMSYADSQEILEKTNRFLRSKLMIFFKIKNIVPVKDRTLQYSGVDKILNTMDGKIIRIEEKVRRITRNDILVELIADNNFYLKKPRGLGWGLKDYSTDLLLYYFEDSNTGWIFSWNKFQKTLLKNLPIWYNFAKNNQYGFSIKKAQNKGYYSINIVIPKEFFLNSYVKEGGAII